MVNAWVATRTQSLTYLRSDSPYVHVLGTLSALHVAFIALAIPVLSNFSVVCGSHCYYRVWTSLPQLKAIFVIESIPMTFTRQKKRISGANAEKIFILSISISIY